MASESILLKYLTNPTIELYFILVLFAFIMGIVGLSYRYFVIGKGDKDWQILKSVDKYFISLVVGFSSVFLSITAYIIYLTILTVVNLIPFITIKQLDDKIVYTCLIVLGFIYQFYVASTTDKKIKGFDYLELVFLKKNLVVWLIIGIYILFIGVGIHIQDYVQIGIGSLILVLVIPYFVKKILKKVPLKKKK